MKNTKIKTKNTKKEQGLLEAHKKSNLYTLRNCYNSWSDSKENAYNRCKARCSEANGTDFKIISYNGDMFTIGYYYTKENKVFFHYESHRSTLDFEVISDKDAK